MSAEQRAEATRQAVDDFVTSLDGKYFRPMQKESYLCCARACDAATDQQDLQNRVNQCQQPLHSAEQVLQRQLQDFQGRLQRCATRCQDSAQESLPSAPGPNDVSKAQVVLENCIADCAEEYQKKIPKMKETTEQQLRQLLPR